MNENDLIELYCDFTLKFPNTDIQGRVVGDV